MQELPASTPLNLVKFVIITFYNPLILHTFLSHIFQFSLEILFDQHNDIYSIKSKNFQYQLIKLMDGFN